jgi:hypothetical protein
MPSPAAEPAATTFAIVVTRGSKLCTSTVRRFGGKVAPLARSSQKRRH